MRAVSIDNLDAGAILGKTIFSPDGRVLLKKGAELSAKAIAALARLGYQYIYVYDPLTGDIEQPDNPVHAADHVIDAGRHGRR